MVAVWICHRGAEGRVDTDHRHRVFYHEVAKIAKKRTISQPILSALGVLGGEVF